jgi:uncharacterized NAD-dependent epimerase/dehydratase family protein
MKQPMITPPYLLYIGAADHPADIKTSRGLAQFRRELCVGEYRHDNSPLTLDLPRMDFAAAKAAGAKTLILGIAWAGGAMTPQMVADVVAALEAGLDVASGLHARLRDQPQVAETAARLGRTLHDVRDPPANLPVGKGGPRVGNRLLTVGTDCSSGKMYTALALEAGMRAAGMTTDFRATGQTGIMVAGSGIPIDAVVADFIAGAAEVLSPPRDDGGWDILEGQGSLFHPSFAGVSLGLLHGARADALVMCHDPLRQHLRGLPDYPVPDLAACIDLNVSLARLTNPKAIMVGIALITAEMPEAEGRDLCARIADETGLPTTDPVAFGVEPIVAELKRCFG